MSTPRIALCLLLAAPVVAAAAAPGWVRAAGLDVWNLSSLHAEVEQETARERSLDVQDDDIRRRIEIKETLVAELIAGHATLAETASQFLSLNQAYPVYISSLRVAYPCGSDEETSARAVLCFVDARLTGLPADQRAEVTARLDAEFNRLFETSATTE